jgi:hypothetical protein
MQASRAEATRLSRTQPPLLWGTSPGTTAGLFTTQGASQRDDLPVWRLPSAFSQTERGGCRVQSVCVENHTARMKLDVQTGSKMYLLVLSHAILRFHWCMVTELVAVCQHWPIIIFALAKTTASSSPRLLYPSSSLATYHVQRADKRDGGRAEPSTDFWRWRRGVAVRTPPPTRAAHRRRRRATQCHSTSHVWAEELFRSMRSCRVR